jgi:hypothetical protein
MWNQYYDLKLTEKEIKKLKSLQQNRRNVGRNRSIGIKVYERKGMAAKEKLRLNML